MKKTLNNAHPQGEQISLLGDGSLSFVEVYFSSAIHGVPITASSPFSKIVSFIPISALSRK